MEGSALASALRGLALAAAATTKSAAGATVALSSDRSASADYRSIDGCVQKDLNIQVTEGTTGGGGSLVRSTQLFLFIDRFDNCSGTLLYSLFVSQQIPAGNFSISPDGDGATLHTVVTGTEEVSGNPVTLAIDAHWTGTGLVLSNRDHRILIFGRPALIQRGAETVRDAAVSASVSDGTTEFVEGSPFQAQLRLDRGGFVTVMPP